MQRQRIAVQNDLRMHQTLKIENLSQLDYYKPICKQVKPKLTKNVGRKGKIILFDKNKPTLYN